MSSIVVPGIKCPYCGRVVPNAVQQSTLDLASLVCMKEGNEVDRLGLANHHLEREVARLKRALLAAEAKVRHYERAAEAT